MKRGKFYVLDKEFKTLMYLSTYKSILWTDRYDECGNFEMVCSPTNDILECCVMDNFIWSSNSETLMIIEKIEYKTDFEEGLEIVISGRDLRCLLERRILLMNARFRRNLEDSLQQILNYAIINPSNAKRKIDNFEFEYSNDERINNLTVEADFDSGTNLLDVVSDVCKSNNIGFKIILKNNKFVFTLFTGDDHTYDQTKNPWIVFSPQHNNLVSTSFLHDKSTDYANAIYCIVDGVAGTERNTGEDGLLRKERSISCSGFDEDSETPEQYRERLKSEANAELTKRAISIVSDVEVEDAYHTEYGVDYFIGDIVQSKNEFGLEEKLRVSEFVMSYDTSGFNMYTTLKETVYVKED